MAGHDLLPGCQRAWNHDECPGYRPAPEDNPFAGVACHCPCHRLARQVALLETENRRMREQLGNMAEEIMRLWADRPPTAPGGSPAAAG